MIQQETILRITDNSGGKYALCIKLIGRYKPRSTGKVGNVIVIVVKKTKKLSTKVQEHKIYYGLIIRTKKKIQRIDGSSISFNNNDIVLLDKNKLPISTRVLGSIPQELRTKGWAKIISISEGIV